VCARSDKNVEFTTLLHDPLIRLVMRSDGVTDADMIALINQISESLAARGQPTF
jgi:hypothetical protein